MPPHTIYIPTTPQLNIAFLDYLWSLYEICKNNYSITGVAGTSIPGFSPPVSIASTAKTTTMGRGYTYAPSAYERSRVLTQTYCPNARNRNLG